MMPEQENLHRVCDLLRHDAMLRSHQGDPEAALESCAAILNAARSLGDEPFVASLVRRQLSDLQFVAALERTLAQGQASDAPLQQLASMVRRERDDLRAHWRQVVRAERAMHLHFFEPMQQRKARLWEQMSAVYKVRLTVKEQLTDYFPALYLRDFPQHLRHRNELVAVSRLSDEEQLERFAALARQVDRRDNRVASFAEFLPLLPPNFTKTCDTYFRMPGRPGVGGGRTGVRAFSPGSLALA